MTPTTKAFASSHNTRRGRKRRTGALKRSQVCALAVTAVIGFSPATPAFADISLTFGTYAADKPTETVRKFLPLMKALETKLSSELGEPVKIKVKVASSYEKGISNLTAGRVDFSRFGPASYVAAKTANSGVQLLAMESVKGQKTFNGVICVQEDSDINSIADLNGRTFAFGSKLSTIGRYLSQKELLDSGIAGKDLKKYAFLGRHDRVGTAVGNGQYDAGALKESTFKKLKKKAVPIRKIASFTNVTKPWIARSGMSEKVASALRNVLLQLKDPKALKSIKKSGFLAASDADYEPIRRAIRESETFDS